MIKKRVRVWDEKYKLMMRLAQQKARGKINEFVRAMKSDRGCLDCGEQHPACLQFHHMDPSQKLFSIRDAISTKVPHPKLIAEIEKCVVLCGNCHAKRHWAERHGETAMIDARGAERNFRS
jgi:hypothetical protein